MQTRKRAYENKDSTCLGLTSFRKPRKEKHPLFHNDRVDFDEIIIDERTGIKMKICEHPMQSLGAGAFRGFGIFVLQRVEANVIFAISEEPLQLMDLATYNVQDYSKNGWIVFGNYASKRNMITMFANTVAPKNEFVFETANCELRDRSLPPSFGTSGKFSYLRSTKVIPANSWALVTKYGKGKDCLRWGQEPTLRIQQGMMAKFKLNSSIITSSKQIGNLVCEGCGEIYPRSLQKVQAHNITCSQKLRR
jgi:hypothetical protein